ncbi:hypothetical protein N665_1281s0001 [Sinapis alba]|nr:hypothetical protein N665_1281s0001 [Sinapis alba]
MFLVPRRRARDATFFEPDSRFGTDFIRCSFDLVAAPKNRFSREQKAKAPASEFSPVRDETGAESPLDDFNLIHRDALMDTVSLTSGVTLLIPNDEQQPWTPPLGYQCVYESYFWRDTKLWFPIPRLITSYCLRRDVAISQFINGPFKIVVALMTMAAKANISMSVCTFEELTTTQPRPHGLFLVKMRPSYNIIKGHPNKTENWNRYNFYVKSDKFALEEPPKDDYRVLWNNKLVINLNTIAYPKKFFENAQAIAALSHLRWPDIIRERIRRVLERISRVNWRSGKKRLQLFPKPKQSRAKRMRPDLSALVGGELGASGDNPMAILDGMNSKAPAMAPISSLAVPQNPEECKWDYGDEDGGVLAPRRRKRSKNDVRFEGNGNDGQDAHSEECVKRWKKKNEVTKNRNDLHDGPPYANDEDHDPLMNETIPQMARKAVESGRMNLLRKTQAKFSDRLSFWYSADVSLISDAHSCAELVHHIKGGPRDMRQVSNLVFVDAYIDAARSSVLGQGRINLVVMEYDRALKHTTASRKKSEESLPERNSYIAKKKKEFKGISTLAIKERDNAIARRKVERKKAGELSAELDTVRARIAYHEVSLEDVRTQTAMIAKRNHRLANIMDYMTCRDAYDEKFLLFAQASRTKKCLELDVIDVLSHKETDLGQEVWELKVGEIPESDLCVSPLILPSQFLNEALLGSIDPFGSNAALIDLSTASNLQTLGGSVEAKAYDGAVDDPAGIEEGGGGNQGRGGDAMTGGEADA